MLDVVGAGLSLLSTYYFIRLNRRAWLVSLFATCLNGVLYWQKGIYADMLLELFYFATACYGWFLWQIPDQSTSNTMKHKLSGAAWMLFIITVIALYLLILMLLSTFTQSTVASLDAVTTSLSLAAQWLMCHKLIATWVLWFITDAIYAYLYLHKQIPFHAILMLVYTGMAVLGFYTWSKQHKRQLDISLGIVS